MKTKLYMVAVVALYLAVALTGTEPFSSDERGSVGKARHGPGGIHGWTSGFMGGK